MLYSTPVSKLPCRPAEIGKVHSFPVADALSAQEEELAERTQTVFQKADSSLLSEPVRYSRIRLPHIHSWLPPSGPQEVYCICQIAAPVSERLSETGESHCTRGVREKAPKGAPVLRESTSGISAAIGCHA